MTGFLGMLVGSAVGAIVAPGEKWEPVDPVRMRVSVIPQPRTRGGGLAVFVSF
jgi:hypothetical protein